MIVAGVTYSLLLSAVVAFSERRRAPLTLVAALVPVALIWTWAYRPYALCQSLLGAVFFAAVGVLGNLSFARVAVPVALATLTGLHGGVVVTQTVLLNPNHCFAAGKWCVAYVLVGAAWLVRVEPLCPGRRRLRRVFDLVVAALTLWLFDKLVAAWLFGLHC